MSFDYFIWILKQKNLINNHKKFKFCFIYFYRSLLYFFCLPYILFLYILHLYFLCNTYIFFVLKF